MTFKKLISVVIMTAMAASLCLVSVRANDLTASNKSTGYVTEIKGSSSDSTKWYRNHTGSNGTKRTSTTMQLNGGQSTGNGTQIVNAHYTDGTIVTDGKFVHASFRVAACSGFQIRLRNNTAGSNYQYVNFNKDGSVTASDSGLSANDRGATWTIAPNPGAKVASYTDSSLSGYYNWIDIVKDMDNHIAYLYVNGTLATYSAATGMDTGWSGYLIYTAGSWSEYDYLIWRVGESTSYHYTIYDDTASHTVTIEDVLNDKGLAPGSPYDADDHLIFANNDISDYVRGNNGATLTYPSAGSMTLSGDYYDSRSGWAQQFLYMFTDTHPGYLLEDELGGDLLYISYRQAITGGSRVEVRIRAGNSNQNNNRLQITNVDGKYRIYAFDQTRDDTNITWGTAIDIGIVIDRSGHKGYTFINGKQLGGAFDFSSKGDFNDLRWYMNGTEDSDTTTVNVSNWLLKQYDSSKQRNELFAEIEGRPVYFKDAGNSISTGGGNITVNVAAQKVYSTADSVVSGAGLYAAAYDDDGNLVNFDVRYFTSGSATSSISFTDTGNEDTVKIFCFDATYGALTAPTEYDVP